MSKSLDQLGENLHHAVCKRDIKLVKEYLIDGANPDFIIDNDKQESALHVAAYLLDVEIMRELIRARGNIFKEEKYGGNVLHKVVASESGHPAYQKAAMIELLYNTSSSIINTKSEKNQETPIYWAVHRDDPDSVLILRALGSDNGPISYSESPYNKSLREGKHKAKEALVVNMQAVKNQYNDLIREYQENLQNTNNIIDAASNNDGNVLSILGKSEEPIISYKAKGDVLRNGDVLRERNTRLYKDKWNIHLKAYEDKKAYDDFVANTLDDCVKLGVLITCIMVFSVVFKPVLKVLFFPISTCIAIGKILVDMLPDDYLTMESSNFSCQQKDDQTDLNNNNNETTEGFKNMSTDIANMGTKIVENLDTNMSEMNMFLDARLTQIEQRLLGLTYMDDNHDASN